MWGRELSLPQAQDWDLRLLGALGTAPHSQTPPQLPSPQHGRPAVEAAPPEMGWEPRALHCLHHRGPLWAAATTCTPRRDLSLLPGLLFVDLSATVSGGGHRCEAAWTPCVPSSQSHGPQGGSLGVSLRLHGRPRTHPPTQGRPGAPQPAAPAGQQQAQQEQACAWPPSGPSASWWALYFLPDRSSPFLRSGALYAQIPCFETLHCSAAPEPRPAAKDNTFLGG